MKTPSIHATIDLTSNRRFLLWKKSILENISRIAELEPCATHGISLLLHHLRVNYHAIHLYDGPALLYKHIWPNGEHKYVVQMGDEIVAEDPFWLSRYPFVEYINSQGKYRLKSEIHSAHRPSARIMHRVLLPTHNMHFGHFIADNLPYLSMLSSLSNSSTPISFACSIPYSIVSELNQIGLTGLAFSPQHKLPNISSIISLSKLHHGYATDHLIKGYILRRLMHGSLHYSYYSQSDIRLPYIFLPRSEKYGSRIANFPEVQSELLKLDFEIITLDCLSLLNCKRKFANTKIIVAESGTTSLIAAVCMPPSAILISLQPRILMSSPTPEMIVSGLPYALCYHEFIKVYAGDTIDCQKIQSSSTAFYNATQLAAFIKPFL